MAALDVLVTEKDEAHAAVLVRVVESLGCTAHLYTSPLASIAAVGERPFDLVICSVSASEAVSVIRNWRKVPHYNEVPILAVIGLAEQTLASLVLEVGATEFVTKPVQEVELKHRLSGIIRLRKAQCRLAEQATALACRAAEATDLATTREEEIIIRLCRAAEQRDNETGNHILRMATLCRIIAEGLGLSPETCRDMFLAAPMHDVGKIGVPDAVLLKPGRLTPEERQLMERHVVLGHDILAGSSSKLIQLAAEIALSHHERWDGRGYPYGLKGRAIPQSGRIAAVADVCDALASDRPYKPMWTLQAVRAYLIKHTGTQFDPYCVRALLKRWEDVFAIYADIDFAQAAAAPAAPAAR
jgi:putative two-component system response regulator